MKKNTLVPYPLRLPENLKTALEKQAVAERRSLNQQIVTMLEHVVSKADTPHRTKEKAIAV